MTRPPIRFDDRVAIVTGAGRGLGREHALFLAARGARVVVNDVAARHADQTVADIVAAGGRAVADHHSVVDAASDIVDTALDAFGGLHVVLNNAGRGGPTGAFVDTTDEQVRAIVDSHLIGTWNVCRAAWPHLAARG
ncbi:MAG: SDR family NAD(P)-dependent oxidoreductase, partial [Ilumatobacteraceae bacterium]